MNDKIENFGTVETIIRSQKKSSRTEKYNNWNL